MAASGFDRAGLLSDKGNPPEVIEAAAFSGKVLKMRNLSDFLRIIAPNYKKRARLAAGGEGSGSGGGEQGGPGTT